MRKRLLMALEASWNERSEREIEVMRINEYLDNFNRGIDRLALESFAIGASPFVIGGAVVYGGAIISFVGSTVLPRVGMFAVGTYKGIKGLAVGYHNTFGKHGGYSSFAGEVISQTNTQLYEKGSVNWRDYNAVGLTSLFVKDNMNIVGGIQGGLGANLSVSLDGKVDGFWNHSAKYNALSTGNGVISGAFGPPFVTDAFSGAVQGIIEKTVK